jgi:hypothetical protein
MTFLLYHPVVATFNQLLLFCVVHSPLPCFRPPRAASCKIPFQEGLIDAVTAGKLTMNWTFVELTHSVDSTWSLKLTGMTCNLSTLPASGLKNVMAQNIERNRL